MPQMDCGTGGAAAGDEGRLPTRCGKNQRRGPRGEGGEKEYSLSH